MVPRVRKAAALIACLTPLAAAAQPAPGFVYENEAEFHSLADINGDGLDDLVVVDKAGGQFRIAEGRRDGSLVWRSNTGDSGLRTVTGFSTGPITMPERAQLLFSSPLDNRIQVIDTPDDRRSTEPQLLYRQLTGPKLVTALNIPGGEFGSLGDDYSKLYYDVAYHATLRSVSQPNYMQLFRNGGAGLPLSQTAQGNATTLEPRRANRIVVEDGTLPVYGVMQDEDPGSGFRLLDPKDGLTTVLASLTGLPDGAAYVYADFDRDGAAEFVFFQPGSATLIESEWTGSGLSSRTNFDYPAPIAEVRVIDSAGTPELLVIRDGRNSADRVLYEGGGSFNLQESFSAGDAPIRGAVNLGEQLHLLEGEGTASSSRSFGFDGKNHQFIEKLPLPSLGSSEAAASLLLFDGTPLTDSRARLVGRVNAGPWTSAFSLSSGEVVNERFQGTSQGLGDARTETLRALPPGTTDALPNQLAPDNSIRFQDPAVGQVTASLSVSPPSGRYDRAIRPVFELQGEGQISYRTSSPPVDWTEATNSSPLILDDTTLYAVAATRSGLSNIVKVDYVITGDPGTRDSDGDGLPDFAASHAGVDPLASDNDADGDGFTDFQEVIAGKDPTSAASQPSRSSVSFEYPNSFNLIAAPGIPEPANVTNLLRSYAVADSGAATGMVVHQPGGLLLGSEKTTANATLGHPAASFQALDVVAEELFLVTASESNFQVDDGGIARDYGRQVAALAKIPELEFTPFDYKGFGDNGGYGNLAAETADWRAAAQTYFNNLQRPEVARDPVGPESTLELLLVETILGQRLYSEGFSDRPELTLTPFRRDEDPLAAIPVGDPLSDPIPDPARDRKLNGDLLQQRKQALSASGSPFHDVGGIIDTVRSELAAANTTGIQQLKALAERLYTTSATSSGATLRQPLPALRQFIRSGNLTNTGYDDSPASSNFPATLLTEAAQGVSDIAGAVSPRTTETVTLYVDGSEAAAACPVWKEVLYTASGFDPDAPNFTGSEYALLDDQGDSYPVARAFPLTPGSVFRVTGYVLDSAPCGDVALEVIPRPQLAFLRNASASDQNGNLIPDGIEERNPNTAFSPFGDTDGDGYSDLQEILDGSDPDNGNDVPMEGGSAAAVAEVGPPQLRMTPAGSTTAAIEFDYPAKYAPFIRFELYSTTDLNTSFSPTGDAANHIGAGNYEEVVDQSGDAEFYIFRMQLK